jgi:hypothetical protein
MGLNISHDCWDGAYSAFMRWRKEIARVSGIPLMLMDSFWGAGNPYFQGMDERLERLSSPSAFRQDNSGGFTATKATLMESLESTLKKDPDIVAMHAVLEDLSPWLPLKWNQLRPDVLHILLNHSDCEGEIKWKYCKPLADRLTELLPLLEGDGGGHVGNYKDKTQKFIDGLLLAHKRKEDVEFF